MLTTPEEFNRHIREKSYMGMEDQFQFDAGVVECDNGTLLFPASRGKDILIRARVKYLTGQHTNLNFTVSDASYAYTGWANFGGRRYGISKFGDLAKTDLHQA